MKIRRRIVKNEKVEKQVEDIFDFDPSKEHKHKPKNAKLTFARLFTYLKPYKIQFIFVIIFVILACGANVAGVYFLKPLINDYVVPFIGDKNPDLSGFINALLLMASIYLVGIISIYTYNRLMMNISLNVLNSLRKEVFSKMQRLPISFFDKHPHGEIMSTFNNDVDAIREMLSQGVPQFINSFITIISVFTVMLIISPILTALVVVMLIVMLSITKKIGARSRRYFRKQQDAISKANGFIEEMIEGQKVVKVFSREERINQDFSVLNNILRESSYQANSNAIILFPINGNLSYLLYVITAIAGSLMMINGIGGLGLGDIASFLQFTRSFGQPINQLSQQFNSIFMALAGAERVFAIIDQTPEEDKGYVVLVNATKDKDGNIIESEKRTGMWAWKHAHRNGTISYVELKGDVVFENVTFGYVEEKTVLKNLNLYARPGQKIAFVGSTGAGKTTITNLINRFYEIQGGKIRYDGINISKIKKDDLRKSLAMVLQDTHLFTGTVKENIRYGKLDATDDEVIEAAKIANAHDFILGLPNGYDTILTSDGTNLSQGQRQLLSIARAAIANPPVLILDEATSSIDTRTEALIEKGMDKLMHGRTVFVIAHRLSTVKNSDAIMVLEHGEIIERGNHDSLIAQKGKYYQLYTGAAELD